MKPLRISPPALEQLVADGASGWFVPGNAPSIADPSAALEADPELRCRRGDATRERARDFTGDAMVDGYIPRYMRQLPAGHTRLAEKGIS